MESKEHENAVVWMSGSYTLDDLLMSRAIVRENISTLTTISVELKSKNKKTDIAKLLGETIRIHVETDKQAERMFSGTCVRVENLGFMDGYIHIIAELRPWFWMLTKTQDCKIYQDKTAKEIIEDVFKENGFSDYEFKLTETYNKRTYCVQYRETDYAFASRLMEEEGMTYYFKNDLDSTSVEKMVICDSNASGHDNMPGLSLLPFMERDDSDRTRPDHVAEWTWKQAMKYGVYTLDDYDFERPQVDLLVKKQKATGKHDLKKYEVFDYPGHFREGHMSGNVETQTGMDIEALNYETHEGATSVRTMSTGYKFKLDGHFQTKKSDEFIVTGAEHYINAATDFSENSGGTNQKKKRRDISRIETEFPEQMLSDMYACTFRCVEKSVPIRAPRKTPRPQLSGLQTAVVVGPSGEEIWPDKYGRVKVQFHWDRYGKKDDKSSCWVRVMTSWAGKQWGMFSIPRVGQEVVVQFEEGDMDRPIVTGMLYNADNMPPQELPANKTQLGIKTNSSKGGKAAKNYNEIWFEDKIGEEQLRFQAEKNRDELIKNSSVVTIGLDAAEGEAKSIDEKSLQQTVKMHVTEMIQEGDHTFTVDKGKQDIEIEGDRTQTIRTGNMTTNVNAGDQTTTVKSGDKTTTVSSGNITVKASMGKISMEAMQEISLKVGGSTIKITPTEVSIKTTMVKIEANATAEMKSPMTTVKGDAMLTLKGGMTMIN